MAAFASAKKVETLEQKVSNLQAVVERQTALIVELRDQVAPMRPGVAYAESVASGRSPAVRHGRRTRWQLPSVAADQQESQHP